MRLRRQRHSGYYDFGPMGWPRPSPVVLQDRTTGTLYLLSHDSDTDEIVPVTPVPRQAKALPSEPLIGTPAGVRRLYVDNGELAAELAPEYLQTRVDPPLFTLNYGDRRTTYEIHGEGATTTTAALCLRKYADLGRVTVIIDLGCNLFPPPAGQEVELGDTEGEGILDTAGVIILVKVL